MNLDSMQDGSRVVVSETRHGSILPSSRAELWRDLFFLPGARLHGSAWGNRLSVSGPDVAIDGAVYVRGELRVVPSEKRPARGERQATVTFGSSVAAADSIFTDGAFTTRFRSNVYTSNAHLRGSVVYGNLYARNAIIRDSVILGGVFCRDTLTIENSIVATFRARRARLGYNVSLLFPVAAADETIEMAAPVRALSFLNLDKQGEEKGGVVLLDASDTYRIAGPDDHTLHVVSIDQRILDGKHLVDQFNQNQRLLELLVLAASLPPAQRDSLQKTGEKIERRLQALLHERDLPEIHGFSSLEELLRRADVIEAIRGSSGVTIEPVQFSEPVVSMDPAPEDLDFSGIDHLFIDETHAEA